MTLNDGIERGDWVCVPGGRQFDISALRWVTLAPSMYGTVQSIAGPTAHVKLDAGPVISAPLLHVERA